MKIIMIPTTNKLYEIPNYKEYELPNKVVDYIKQLEEESKNNYFVHMKEWANALGNNVKLQQKIDKAIEYINNNSQYDDNIDDYWTTTNDLLNILRGENNE